MKKIIFVLALLLVGCSNQIDYQFEKEMSTIQKHMEQFAVGNGDYKQLESDTEAFNNKLNKIETDDKQIKKFVEYQLKANELRLKGVKNNDSETITESAKYQAFAENIYYELEDSK